MAAPRRRTLAPKDPPPAPPEAPRPLAVLDLGASAIRLLIAEAPPGQPTRILEEATRGVLLGKDTFTHGRLGAPTIEATLKALEGFRRLMDTYGVVRYRAVATSAVREAANRDAFLDRVRLRTGIDVEVIDGTEENRLTYMAVRETLRDHPALARRRHAAGRGGRRQRGHLVPAQGTARPLGHLPAGLHPDAPERRLLAGQPRPGHRACCGATSTTSSTTSAARCRCARPTHFIALGGDVRFAAAQMRDASGPAGRRDAGAAARALPLLRGPDQLVRRRAAGRGVPAAPGGRGDPGPRAPRLPRAADRDGRRERRGARRLAARGPAARPRRRPTAARASRTSAGRCWPAPPPSASKYRWDVAHARNGGAALGRASSTSCAPSTASPSASGCCWRWRRSCTTSATT